jgi:ABC-type glutathione transport system ATPase component
MEQGALNATKSPEKAIPERISNAARADSEIIFSMNMGIKEFRGSGTGAAVTALSEVSFDIRRNHAMGITGKSGSGKSTIARIMTGLDMLDSGEMKLHGEVYRPRDKTSRKAVQMIFQDPFSSLYPHKTAGYCIGEALEIHTTLDKMKRQRKVKQLMQAVGLPVDFINRSTRSLSGGERQRVQIARALAVEPEILICDECTNGLDPEVEARIIELLGRLTRERGMSLVFISHDLGVLRALVQELVVMSQGRIVESGKIGNILGNPQHPATQNLV